MKRSSDSMDSVPGAATPRIKRAHSDGGGGAGSQRVSEVGFNILPLVTICFIVHTFSFYIKCTISRCSMSP
jgi:hypothetical protein